MRNMTEIPQYLEYGQCLAAGNTPGALRCLDECIARVRAEQDAQAAARLFQYKGNLLYQTGDPAGAEASYQSALDCAPDSPIVLMGYARFLATTGAQPGALDALTRLEAILDRGWEPDSPGAYPAAALRERIAEIRAMMSDVTGVSV